MLTKSEQLSRELRKYHTLKHQLFTVDSTILYKQRVVISVVLRKEVLDNSHGAHQGVNSMTVWTRTFVFRPGINADMKRTSKRCAACNSMAPTQPQQPPITQVTPLYVFQYVCFDLYNVKFMNIW